MDLAASCLAQGDADWPFEDGHDDGLFDGDDEVLISTLPASCRLMEAGVGESRSGGKMGRRKPVLCRAACKYRYLVQSCTQVLRLEH